MFRVTYHQQAWSEPFELLDTGAVDPDSKTLDCGTSPSIDAFLEGSMPGEYWFDSEDGTESYVVVIGRDAREEYRAQAGAKAE